MSNKLQLYTNGVLNHVIITSTIIANACLVDIVVYLNNKKQNKFA